MLPNLNVYEGGKALLLVSGHFTRRLEERSLTPVDASLDGIRAMLLRSWYVRRGDDHQEAPLPKSSRALFYLVDEETALTSVVASERDIDVLKTVYLANQANCWSRRWLRRTPESERLLFGEMVRGLDFRLCLDIAEVKGF